MELEARIRRTPGRNRDVAPPNRHDHRTQDLAHGPSPFKVRESGLECGFRAVASSYECHERGVWRASGSFQEADPSLRSGARVDASQAEWSARRAGVKGALRAFIEWPDNTIGVLAGRETLDAGPGRAWTMRAGAGRRAAEEQKQKRRKKCRFLDSLQSLEMTGSRKSSRRFVDSAHFLRSDRSRRSS